MQRITFAGAVSLTNGTAYWIVVSASGHAATAEPIWYIGLAAGGGGRATYNGSTWTTDTTTHYYVFEEQVQLAAAPTAMAVFNSAFYLGAGTRLYKRVTGANPRWTLIDTLASAITDMDVLDSTMWISTGKGNNAYTMNTSDVTAVQTGITGQMVVTYGGFLYRANGNQLFYSSDGTTWTSTDADGNTFLFGNTNYNITGMAGLGDSLYVAKPDGLWAFERGDFVERVARWETQFDTNNGRSMVEWNGALYIPMKGGLVKFDGKGNFDSDVGPNRDEGLPSARVGNIVSMVALLNYLVVAVDADGASDYGSVLLYNGYGWHEIGRTWQAGQRVRVVGYDSLVSDWYKVLYGMGQMVGGINDFADATDFATWNPADSQIAGYVETSWISGGLLDVWKLLASVWVAIEGDDNIHDLEQRIHIDYRVDRQTAWRYLDEVYLGGGQEISLQTADSVGSPGTVSSIDSTTGDVTLSAIGGITANMFVRLGHETRYITEVSGAVITPLVAYENAAVGEQAYGGFPTCREVQLRLRIYGGTAGTLAVVRAVRLNWANQLTRWRRWQMTIRCEDNMQRLDGTLETRSAATIYNDLMEMLSGSTLFTLNDIDEVNRTVQLINAQPSEPELKYDIVSGTSTTQRTVTLDVVEI